MGAYDFNFDLPPGETYIPNSDRVRALQALLPPAPFALAPKADDRAAWSRWQDHPLGQRVLREACELAGQPYPEYNNATYLDSLDREDVTKVNQVMPIARRRQVVFMLAEAIFDRGEFLGLISSDARQLAQLNSWIHPGNDLKRLNYDLKTVEPDLGVVHFAENFALTDFILGDRLPADTRALIREEINRRVLAPTRHRIETGRDLNWWIRVKHNWKSVLLSCIAQTACAILPAATERAWWLAFAEAQVKRFRDDYTDEGFCTEGVSYWSYGFMHYVSMSELLRVATGNVIDLLDEPKMALAARFPDHAEIQPGVYPTFADCALNVKPLTWVRLWIDNRAGHADQPLEPVPTGTDPFDGMALQMISEPLLWMFRTRDPLQPQRLAHAPGLREWFEQPALLVCRPAPTTQRRFSATIIGGHNGVNHNHNDLGTFTVVLDGRVLVLDPGPEIYSYRTFSEKRYDSQLLNSYGHPVPRVAGQLQEFGPQYRARVIAKEFSEATDRIIFDLRGAYDVPALRKLEREFLFDRRGDGSLTITDRVEFSAPATFETALITLGQFTVNGASIRIHDDHAALLATVTCAGAELETALDTINQPPHPNRLALRCKGTIGTAVIRTVFTPA
ncbi:MAG: heparinase II/III family protein [Opitutaceae bacterium]|nr:heparinase II/III family protein [Opitutaceae bacterium]